MKKVLFVLSLASCFLQGIGQVSLDLSGISKNGALVASSDNKITVEWPAGQTYFAKIIINLQEDLPLFHSILLGKKNSLIEIAKNIDPVFVLRTGKRKLSAASAEWDIFFDNVFKKPYTTQLIEHRKTHASVITVGSRTVVRIGELKTDEFSGEMEITIYNGSPLLNIAAVMTTQKDSVAILYDAGLTTTDVMWKNIAWSDSKGNLQYEVADEQTDSSQNLAVKYRTIVGETNAGSLAVFPPPHQYFYPLDEAFNLKFTWYGKEYLNKVKGYGIGIRQQPEGDRRYVPWFNSPPGTRQRLNFFCLLGSTSAVATLREVKKFTNNDTFVPLPGYKTMATHFHNEFISDVVLSGKEIPENPEFVEVLKSSGIDIVKLAEFHGPGHPKGPDSLRLKELQALFTETQRLSGKDFLLLPGEEANNFYGGHWLAFFPKPVYWVMAKPPGIPFLTNDSTYGKVYHIGSKEEMLKLLELEKGLAWVAHARTKGSTGYPDKYKEEAFFKSPTYMGAAWKAIPADLSWETLSKRVLTLLDDMSNWGHKKYVIAESDIFTITEQNEMYAHLNVNYLRLKELPSYHHGWQTVLNAMNTGAFFVSTGEVLIPLFRIKGKQSGESVRLNKHEVEQVEVELHWTFPLAFAEIVSGDGQKVYRDRITLTESEAFGRKKFVWTVNVKNRKWVRVEVWDVAANGSFTQPIWLE